MYYEEVFKSGIVLCNKGHDFYFMFSLDSKLFLWGGGWNI